MLGGVWGGLPPRKFWPKYCPEIESGGFWLPSSHHLCAISLPFSYKNSGGRKLTLGGGGGGGGGGEIPPSV